MNNFIHESNCPACGHHVAVSFFDGGEQPLATIAWPASREIAQSMRHFPLQFVECAECGHVFNNKFDYNNIPYSDKPNLMFNNASIWKTHLTEVCNKILRILPKNPIVVEIGCGEGHLLNTLSSLNPTGRYIGFDPNSSVTSENRNIEFYQQLFEPTEHLNIFRPDMVISRHVLEHLMNPLRFLQRLSFVAEWLNLRTYLFLEVPCIDRVFTSGRVADFYYEHNSHFTTRSFTCLLNKFVRNVLSIEHGYNGEVISAIAQLGEESPRTELVQKSLHFYNHAKIARDQITKQLDEISGAGQKVAIWGGTGKGAAFINYYGVDTARFPIVVDSDPAKTGTFVPGSGHLIRFRDYLKHYPADIILIPTQWRAKDIIVEMNDSNISFRTILIEHDRKLIDYFKDDHPYK